MRSLLSLDSYWLTDLSVPSCLIHCSAGQLDADEDGVYNCDIQIKNGRVHKIVKAGHNSKDKNIDNIIRCDKVMCWPTMADMHTHIDKAFTCERSKNISGTLDGADESTDRDSSLWTHDDLYRRMDFSIQCAYAHGTSALRTHLLNNTKEKAELTWPIFLKLKEKWAGKVELQAVSLVGLSLFRDESFGNYLADLVQNHGGILGAAVCCTSSGGLEKDDLTTCHYDRNFLLDRVFKLSKERDLDLDFHVDENLNRESKGLLEIAKKTIEYNYHKRVVCGHCCSLVFQTPEKLQEIAEMVKAAQITIVSLPLVNQWTQDRTTNSTKTPMWRGVTALHELEANKIPIALASDNVRDQFYPYGDYDMIEIFSQGVKMGHLDRPFGNWPASVCSVPARAMKLEEHGVIKEGSRADIVLFKAKNFSELLSRSQQDRIVIRDGKIIDSMQPDYRDLEGLVKTAENYDSALHITQLIFKNNFKFKEESIGNSRYISMPSLDFKTVWTDMRPATFFMMGFTGVFLSLAMYLTGNEYFKL